jgi:hypothetical protein
MVMGPRVLVVGPALLLLGLASFTAIRYGLVGSVTGNATRELEIIAKTPGTDRGPWWRDDLRRAAGELPRDPTVRELKALAVMSRNDATEYAEAEQDLAAAIESRPGSGYTWAHLALLKYRVGDTGPGFEKAVQHAVALAPYEPEVQRMVADVGLAVLDEMQPVTRAAIERAVVAGLKRNAPEILQIAARRGRLNAVCRHFDRIARPAESKSKQLCQSMEATS